MYTKNKIESAKARLMVKVNKIADTGCWEFTGFRLPNGYGRIQGLGVGPVLAHRLSYILHIGEIPKGCFVLHRCDNRPCVNPEHLFTGSQKDNMVDCAKKGRNYIPTISPKTRNNKHWNCKFTECQVQEIRGRSSEPRKKLALEFGTSAKYISSIICGTKRNYVYPKGKATAS